MTAVAIPVHICPEEDLPTSYTGLRYTEHGNVWSAYLDGRCLGEYDRPSMAQERIEACQEQDESGNSDCTCETSPKKPCPACAAKIAGNPQTPRCPNWEHVPGGLMGCGSANVSEPDEEGLRDCYYCGIWFPESQAYGQPAK